MSSEVCYISGIEDVLPQILFFCYVAMKTMLQQTTFQARLFGLFMLRSSFYTDLYGADE